MARRRKFVISIDQEHLPFGAASGGLLAHATRFERGLLGIFLGSFAIFTILYVYFVIASVAHVASREELVREGASISAAVGSMEAQYLTKIGTITEAHARSRGFVAAGKQVFVERASLVTLHNAQ